MKFKSFLSSSISEEERVKSVSAETENNELMAKVNLSGDHDTVCVKCRGNQNVKLANIAAISENTDENQYFLCENCRKASFKVKISR